MLDEIDKVGADWRGDPSSALLEVLDPAQNHSFRDHYLDVELDLSEVLFIATANVVDTIPGPLLDRMEVIALDGYTEDEKLAIARGYLRAPPDRAQRPARGRGRRSATRRLAPVIGDYTREAGRARPRARDRQAAPQGGAQRRRGRRDARSPSARRPATRPSGGRGSTTRRPSARPRPGVATGLAVTGAGGDVLFVEASAMPADGPGDRLVLTGQLGDVMRESARIALSWTRSHGADIGIDPSDHRASRRSTSTSPRARCPRTGRRPASRWSRRWPRSPPGARCARTSG